MKQFGESYYLGPDIDKGPLPTLFYFGLSAEESLQVDPYNQPASFLNQFRFRIFSLDLPAHGPNLPAIHAMSAWAEEISLGRDLVTPFVEKVKSVIHNLKLQGALIDGKLGVAGLSRGAFIASHVAASIPEITAILGFAPLIELSFIKEFKELPRTPLAESLGLKHLIPFLIGRTLRFYIGNLDTRVGTHHAFHFIESLAKESFHHKIRSPQVELFIKPSIGQHGHGTSKETFHEGAAWIAEQLGLIE
jgi:esterase FrsA